MRNFYTNGGVKEDINRVNFGAFELPFRFSSPWTMSLKEKKVLVISPFADLIENQYKNRRRLFPSNELFLPDFDLKTLKAVDTAGENWKYSGYQTWTDALIAMEEQIKKLILTLHLLAVEHMHFLWELFVKRWGKKL